MQRRIDGSVTVGDSRKRMTTQFLKRCALLLAFVAIPACSGDPFTLPSSTLPFQVGNYHLALIGQDQVVGLSGVQAGCPGIEAAGIGIVTTNVGLRNDGAIWRGLPLTVADGSFELRFQEGFGNVGPLDVPLVGTLHGTLNDSAPTVPNDRGAKVSFANSGPGGQLEGVVDFRGTSSIGTLSAGAVTFSAADGTTISCNEGTVRYALTGPL